jgi:hypothetical protein
LLRVKFFNILHPKAKKVRKLEANQKFNRLCPVSSTDDANLCSSINLCLPNILSLSQDSSSDQFIPVLFADEFCSLEKDGSAIAPRHGFPSGLGCKGSLNRPCNSCLVCLMICAEVPGMVRRNQLLSKLACLDLCKRPIHASITVRTRITKVQDTPAPHL